MVSVSELIVGSYDFLKNNFKALLKVALLWTAVVFLDAAAYANIVGAFGETWQAALWSFLVRLPFNLILMIILGALILQIDTLAKGKVLQIKEGATQALKKIIPLVVSLVSAFALTVAGLVALIIPGIIFGVWFAFAAMFVMLEEGGAWSSLKLSKELTGGKFAYTFLRLFAPTFFWGLTGFLLIGIFRSGLFISGLNNLTSNLPSWKIVYDLSSSVIESFINSIVSILFVVVNYLLYKDLKR